MSGISKQNNNGGRQNENHRKNMKEYDIYSSLRQRCSQYDSDALFETIMIYASACSRKRREQKLTLYGPSF